MHFFLRWHVDDARWPLLPPLDYGLGRVMVPLSHHGGHLISDEDGPPYDSLHHFMRLAHHATLETSPLWLAPHSPSGVHWLAPSHRRD